MTEVPNRGEGVSDVAVTKNLCRCRPNVFMTESIRISPKLSIHSFIVYF